MERFTLSRRALSGAIIALGVVGFASAAFSAAKGDPIKIGVIIGLTGPNAVAGNDGLGAMQLAVDEVNAAGGVMGRPLELIVEDNEGRPKAGVEAANKLADVDQVPVVVGGYSSAIALPVGQVLNKKKVVWVTDATTNKLKTVGPYLFNTAGIAEQAVALVDFAKTDSGAKTLAGLFQNNPIGQDRAAVSEKRAKEIGLEWTHNMLYQVGAKDFRAELTKLLAAKPDAILTDIYDNDAQIIQRQLYEMGVTDMSMFYSYNLSAFATLPPKFTLGMKGLSYATAGARAAAFNEKFQEKFGRIYTDAWAPPFYDAVWIVATAMNLANSLDSTEIRNAMWPAAYRYSGVSGLGDKGFNRWGMQHGDQNAQAAFMDGKIQPYFVAGSSNNVLIFRYEDANGVPATDGIPLAEAPSEEELKALYSGN